MEQALISQEQLLNQIVNQQRNIDFEAVTKYISLLDFYSDQSKFPSTFTSLLFNTLVMNPQYDSVATIPIINSVRHNIYLINLLKIDVFTPTFIDGIIADPESSDKDMVIDKDKYGRMGLICAIYGNLIKITEVKYMQVILKHFLIQDYDKANGQII